MTSSVTFHIGPDVSTSSIDLSKVAVVAAAVAAAIDIYASHAGGRKMQKAGSWPSSPRVECTKRDVLEGVDPSTKSSLVSRQNGWISIFYIALLMDGSNLVPTCVAHTPVWLMDPWPGACHQFSRSC